MVPTEAPNANGTWLNTDILALPLAPVDGMNRVVLYNRTANTTHTIPVAVGDIRDLALWETGSTELVLTGLDEEGIRRPYRLDTATGDLLRALPWLNQPIERLSVAKKAGLVAWSTDKTTEIAQLSDGTTLHLLPGVHRAVPHEDGRWILLETLGTPISVFNQHTWGEGTEASRARDQVRHEKWIERHLDGKDEMVEPPEIHLLDRTTGKRFRITAFMGDHLQWYPAPGHYVSFMMWGIEGKQFNRNIGLTTLSERIRMIGLDQLPLGIEQVLPLTSAPANAPLDGP